MDEAKGQEYDMKQIFNLIALVAIAHFLILSGLIGYLIASGKLNSESATLIASALRGDKLTTQPATAPAAATTQPKVVEKKKKKADHSFEATEMQLAVIDRQKRTLEDRYERVRDAELKLIHDRENFLSKRKNFFSQVEMMQKAGKDEGFKKALELYSKIPAKEAKDDFMKLDTDIVVKYMINMSKQTAAKILREFKTPAEQKKREEILEHIRTREILVNTAAQEVQG